MCVPTIVLIIIIHFDKWLIDFLCLLNLTLVITSLVSCGHCILCLLSLMASDYPFGILWSLYSLSA
jgi:hypothetical protein